MALVSCSECAAQISDRAAKCPRCGCPVTAPPAEDVAVEAETRHRSSRKWVAGGVVLAVLIVALVFFAAPGDGLRKGDEVVIKASGGVRATVLGASGDVKGRPMVRIRMDNGPKAAVRYEEMSWPVDELEKVDPTGAKQTH